MTDSEAALLAAVVALVCFGFGAGIVWHVVANLGCAP